MRSSHRIHNHPGSTALSGLDCLLAAVTSALGLRRREIHRLDPIDERRQASRRSPSPPPNVEDDPCIDREVCEQLDHRGCIAARAGRPLRRLVLEPRPRTRC